MLKTITAMLLFVFVSTSMAVAQRSLLDLRPGKKQSSERAIVFVHGWCSSAATAFKARGASVDRPGLLEQNRDLSKAHKNFDVFAFDYSAAQRKQTSLLDLAQSLIERLDDQSVFSKYAEVYFVAHSLGGLVVKKTILVLREKKRQTRLDRIGGAIFLGVPSNGHSAADWVSNNIIGTFTRIIRSWFGDTCGNHDLVDELRTKSKSDKLRDLEASWQNYLEAPKTKSDKWRISTYCGYEGKAMRGFVVAQTSARSKCGEERQFPNKNHFELVAPSDVKDEVYVWVGNRLKLAVERFDALKRFLVSNDDELQNRLILKGIVKRQ